MIVYKYQKTEVIMEAKAIRPFIPSKDFEVSKAFYKDLGFEITYDSSDLVVLTNKDASFFLQKAFSQEWANNSMVQLFVDDLAAFFEIANLLNDKYKDAKIKPIIEADYGTTFQIIDPAGVCWHIM